MYKFEKVGESRPDLKIPKNAKPEKVFLGIHENKVVARAIFSRTPGGVVYCALSIDGNILIPEKKGTKQHYTGKAGGWGYEKRSAALSDAISRAGFEASKDFDGSGDVENPFGAFVAHVFGQTVSISSLYFEY